MKKFCGLTTSRRYHGTRTTGLWLGEDTEFVEEVIKRISVDLCYVQQRRLCSPLDPGDMNDGYAYPQSLRRLYEVHRFSSRRALAHSVSS